VQVKLDAEAFQYWNEAAHAWATASDVYQVMAGRSSRDIVYRTKLAAPAAASR
jgi:hypothetical protein